MEGHGKQIDSLKDLWTQSEKCDVPVKPSGEKCVLVCVVKMMEEEEASTAEPNRMEAG